MFVLDPAGKSNNYARRDGMTHAEILEVRKEEDKRKVVLFITWPSEFKLYAKQKLKQAREATKGKVQALLADHAEHVAFGDCKDDQGHLLPKILVFIRHSEASSMAELAPALRRVRYIDVGLEELVKTTLNKADLSKLGIKSCCYTPACVQGQFVPAKNGRPARPAPKCDAGQRAYASRMCFSARPARTSNRTDRHADKRAGEEQRANAARAAISKAYRPPQECRAHEAGRCTKGDQCYESHNVPDWMIMCCSMRKPKPGQKLRYTRCTSLRVGKECPYSHEPVQEQTEEEKAEAELFDATMFDETSEAVEIAQAEEAEKQSAAATAAATAATAAAGAAVAAAAAAAAVAAEAAAAATAAASALEPGGAGDALLLDALLQGEPPANEPPVGQGAPTPQHQPMDPALLASQQALLASRHQCNHAIKHYASAQPGAEEPGMLDGGGL